jgi:hypothetical protein
MPGHIRPRSIAEEALIQLERPQRQMMPAGFPDRTNYRSTLFVRGLPSGVNSDVRLLHEYIAAFRLTYIALIKIDLNLSRIYICAGVQTDSIDPTTWRPRHVRQPLLWHALFLREIDQSALSPRQPDRATVATHFMQTYQ